MKQTENLYTPNCIRTVSGIYVDIFDPKPEMFTIEDIAHSLSNQCRFAGHLPIFYCVAQHSLNVSYLVSNPKQKLAALLHDASEAYLLDIPKPIKSGLSNYKEIEDGLMRCIAERFGFDYPLHKDIKIADETMLQVEWDTIMLGDSGLFKVVSTNEIRHIFKKMANHYTALLNKEQNAQPDDSSDT